MKLKSIALLLMATIVSSCGMNAQNANETKVLIKTTAGDITVKLYNETPIHRDNFIKLVEEHYYDSLLFHRVIRDFMVQAGDPDSRYADKRTKLGSGGPEYSLPAEFVYPKYFHKYGALSAARRPDQSNPERMSSGSQFYIVTGKSYRSYELDDMETQITKEQKRSIFDRLCATYRDSIIALQEAEDDKGLMELQDMIYRKADEMDKEQGAFKFNSEQRSVYTNTGGAPYLDGQYTVFGEVIDGMKIVDRIGRVTTDGNDRPVKDIRILTMEILK